MIFRIIDYSVKNKILVFLLVLAIVGFGIFSLVNIPIGAVPDVTNNQVQVITTTRDLAAEDVEKFITYPIELEMANLPGVEEIRSISKFGLSVVTIVFEDRLGTYLPRQLIAEKIEAANEKIPEGFGSPFMGPISTGLGEIYQYTLDVKPEFAHKYDVTELRTIQDWIVKRQLSGIPGVVEVNTWGGFLKTYEVALDPQRLKSLDINLNQVFKALKDNNSIAGGGYIEKQNEAFFIRSEGLLSSIEDINNIVVTRKSGLPIYIKDIAEVNFGAATRFGAITGNAVGEKVLGQVMMLKGANSKKVIDEVKKRVKEIEPSLPEGVYINPIVERSALIDRTTATITENLVYGFLIVLIVVVFLLGDFRSGLVVASVIPLTLLFALSLMYIFGVDANLMSLGAIDFGIIIDGAVIIVEFIAFSITKRSFELLKEPKAARRKSIDKIAVYGANKMMHSAIFGQLIIIIVFIPILSLAGVEGKMFRPMALTFCFALLGAMLLCFTYVPVMASLFIRPMNGGRRNLSAGFIQFLQIVYQKLLKRVLQLKVFVLSIAIVLVALAFFIFNRMGAEFIPTLDEGDFVIQPVLKTGMSLKSTVEMTSRMEKILMRFPEVNQIASRIGAAEVPTDPMSMEESDIIISLHDKGTWTSAKTKDELADVFKEALVNEIPGVEIEFTQPIEMRFNELITGVRADLAIKIFGADNNELFRIAQEIEGKISDVRGAADISVEKIDGLPQMQVKYDRLKMAKYGVNISDLNDIISMGFAGKTAGSFVEGEKWFDLVVRYQSENRNSIEDIQNSLVPVENDLQLPLSEFADISLTEGPAKISRDDTKRRAVVGINVRGRDLQSVVDEVQEIIEREVDLEPGYYIEYGGQFENLQDASRRLLFAVPIALLLIFILLYFAFHSVKEALLIFSAIPLAAVGGVLALYFRDMPFSISAGIGFIALFGIAVLNGIVLIEHIKELKKEPASNIDDVVLRGAIDRLRPVLLTATAAAFGFLPMAISTSAGAEVQRPLATVVIGGLISATILTLFVLPVLFSLFERKKLKPIFKNSLTILFLLVSIHFTGFSQDTIDFNLATEMIEENPEVQKALLEIQKQKTLIDGAFDIDKTSFFYSWDRNNIALNDRAIHVLGAGQQFKLPKVYSLLRKEQSMKVGISESQANLTTFDLKHYLKILFEDYDYWNQIVMEYLTLDSIYKENQEALTKKVEFGESNRISLQLNQQNSAQIKLKLEKAIAERNYKKDEIQQFLFVEPEALIEAGVYDKRDFVLTNQSVHPLILLEQMKYEWLNVLVESTSSQSLPEFGLSLFAGLNSLVDPVIYPGVEFGISVPLFKKSYTARTKAMKIDREKQALQIMRIEKQIQWEIIQLEALRAQFDSQLRAYEEELLPNINALNLNADKTFRNGEIDYFDYFRIIENGIQIKLDYLELIHQYNQNLIAIEYYLNR